MSTASHSARRRQFWLEHIEACAESGDSAKTYAETHGLSSASFYTARSRYKQASSRLVDDPTGISPSHRSARFVRVEPLVQARGARVECRARMTNGAMLELGVDVSDLEMVLRALATVT